MPAASPLSSARKTAFIYSEEFLTYNLGGSHPLQQNRLRMVYDLLAAYGAFSPGGPIDHVLPEAATEAELLRVHSPDFLQAVRAAGKGDRSPVLQKYGLGPGDTPAFDGMFEAASLYAGGTAQGRTARDNGRLRRGIQCCGRSASRAPRPGKRFLYVQ